MDGALEDEKLSLEMPLEIRLGRPESTPFALSGVRRSRTESKGPSPASRERRRGIFAIAMDESPRPIRVVELSTVTDETLEDTLNEWTAKGYHLDGIHFAMRESSKRPAMAFLVFRLPTSA